MALRVIVFVDFWNLQLGWNREAAGRRLDWLALPNVLATEAACFATAREQESSAHEVTTIIYASWNPTNETKLKGWLVRYLGKRPEFTIKLRERRFVQRKFRCSHCVKQFANCPACGQSLLGTEEKGVDTAIATDLVALAADGECDLAILVSDDADHVPAVEWAVNRGVRVVNATWVASGSALSQASSQSTTLIELIPVLSRG